MRFRPSVLENFIFSNRRNPTAVVKKLFDAEIPRALRFVEAGITRGRI
jgi:hypothetical protein